MMIIKVERKLRNVVCVEQWQVGERERLIIITVKYPERWQPDNLDPRYFTARTQYLELQTSHLKSLLRGSMCQLNFLGKNVCYCDAPHLTLSKNYKLSPQWWWLGWLVAERRKQDQWKPGFVFYQFPTTQPGRPGNKK